MSKNSLTSTPIGVLLIAGFYIFGAISLLVIRIINPGQAAAFIAERHGLPATTGNWILLVVVGIALLIAYGLVSRSRWGFFFTIAYQLYFAAVNLYLSDAMWATVSCGNAIWSFLVIGYLILVRRQFLTAGKVSGAQLQQ